MSVAVTQLVEELLITRAQRDEALLRESERADALQRMLGADKALSVFVRVLHANALAALQRWRAHCVEAGFVDALNHLVLQPSEQRAAAETRLQLEAEEMRRSEAERLAFDEGRRRRKAEEELRARADEVSAARTALTAAAEAADGRLAAALEASVARPS